ncbi:MAG: copper resistance protein CopC [Thermomicrobiales bacterium]
MFVSTRARGLIRDLGLLLALGVALLLWQQRPADVSAHATLVRSEPAAGATLSAAPETIRLWFSEPLEHTFTRAELLDSSGSPVAGVVTTIPPDHSRELVLALPGTLPPGQYTVAWRTLSAADGHTLQGYFGFGIGVAGDSRTAATVASDATLETWRGLSRGLALIGLALVLAIAPMTLFVLDPGLRPWPEMATAVTRRMRRFAAVAACFAIVVNVAALALQAVSILPDGPLFAAIAGTLPTRYGTLWLARMALLLVVSAALLIAVRRERGERTRWLAVAAIAGIAAPVPFSLLSHAAALEEGRAVAVAADALHLLLAAVWGGGVVVFAIAVAPSLRGAERGAVWRSIIPRFSTIALAAWGVLVLTGLYASWLQVGSREALTDTPYGRSLLLKGALLIPVLALGAYHLQRGRRVAGADATERSDRTLAAEAILVLAVLVVIGRLIGQEPAREVLASQTPGFLAAPLLFASSDGARGGTLTVSPGAAGANRFNLDLPGPPLPEGAEAVLRFSLPERDIGAQELRLSRAEGNQFRAEGSELALTGTWQIEAIVRKIGAFSWPASAVLAIAESPSLPPAVNPAPLFAPSAVVALILLALGLLSLSTALAVNNGRLTRMRSFGLGLALIGVGVAGMTVTRLQPPAPLPLSSVAAPSEADHSPEPAEEHMGHVMGTPMAGETAASALPAPGTPVTSGELTLRLLSVPEQAGLAPIAVSIRDASGQPVVGAKVVVISTMVGMATSRTETAASEPEPGVYEAAAVPLTMSGPWQIAVRASPRGQPSATARWQIAVP